MAFWSHSAGKEEVDRIKEHVLEAIEDYQGYFSFTTSLITIPEEVKDAKDFIAAVENMLRETAHG